MKHQSYFVNGLTTNQKTFLESNGCSLEPYRERFNYWIFSKDGHKVTVKNEQAKAAWGLIQNSDLTVIPVIQVEGYTKEPLSGTRADWVIVDEVENISEELWGRIV